MPSVVLNPPLLVRPAAGPLWDVEEGGARVAIA